MTNVTETHTRTVTREFTGEEIHVLLTEIVAREAKMLNVGSRHNGSHKLYDNVTSKVSWRNDPGVSDKLVFSVKLTQNMLQDAILPEADPCGP